jgi:hypothetical protein
MKYFFTLLFFSSLSILTAQQWIIKKYSYDSTMNVTYGTAINFNGKVDTLKMDIYEPSCGDISSKKPLLIWIHGGAFLAGDKNESSITNLCKQFAKRGYVTASINYRLGFVSDDVAWNCNFPNYSCVFAGDSAEWIRAWYRGVQDAKGALRYLINRCSQLKIDVNNVFIAGESAGSLISLGVGLLDTIIERMPQTFAIGALPNPNNNTSNCSYNTSQTFTSANVPRPDLGGIDGIIEPSTINYTIKGIGNNYGALFSNLLKYSKAGHTKPAIYSFHQPCDIVVPIDSGQVYQGLSWCMTNGYNCYAIKNTAKLYGSRTFSIWNTTNNHGYTIHNEFTSTAFPYSFLFGTGSCADQVNNPCHAYDNSVLRENNLAAFFAPLISATAICDTGAITSIRSFNKETKFYLYPNPTDNTVTFQVKNYKAGIVRLYDLLGVCVKTISITQEKTEIDLSEFSAGVYYLTFTNKYLSSSSAKIIKN